MEEKIKMQSNGKKQQFRRKNDLMDDLISCLENFEVVHWSLKASILNKTDKHNTRYYGKVKTMRISSQKSFPKLQMTLIKLIYKKNRIVKEKQKKIKTGIREFLRKPHKILVMLTQQC